MMELVVLAPFARLFMSNQCTHLNQIQRVELKSNGCEECLVLGWSWVRLRMCLSCGHVGCCDSSKGKHAAAHFHATSHPLMRSIERGEDWGWCYIDETYIKRIRNVIEQQLGGTASGAKQ